MTATIMSAENSEQVIEKITSFKYLEVLNNL
jgi:hypothetical protein